MLGPQLILAQCVFVAIFYVGEPGVPLPLLAAIGALVYVVSLGLHEAAHIVVGRLNGLFPSLIQFGPYLFHRSDGEWRRRLFLVPSALASVVFGPTPRSIERRAVAFRRTAIAGPLCSLVVGMALLLPTVSVFTERKTGVAFACFALASGFNLFIGITSIGAGDFQRTVPDGKTFLGLHRRGTRQAYASMLSTASIALSDLRPGQWSEATVAELLSDTLAQPRNPDERLSQLGSGCLLTLLYLEHRRWDDARRVLRHVVPYPFDPEETADPAHASLLVQSAFIAAWVDHDPVLGQSILDHATRARSAIGHAAEAAIALRLGRLDEARDAALSGLSLVEMLSGLSGVRLLERDLLLAVVHEIERQRLEAVVELDLADGTARSIDLQRRGAGASA